MIPLRCWWPKTADRSLGPSSRHGTVRGSIYRLVVAPGHRRQGLGRLLLARAEARLQEAGAVRAQAIVVELDELPAVGFWRASGWEEQTERIRFVKG